MDPRLIVKVADAPGRTAGEQLRVVTLADGTTYTYSYGADTPPARIDQIQGTIFNPANFQDPATGAGMRLLVTGRDEDVAKTYAQETRGPTGRGTEGGAPYIVGGQRFDPGTNTFIDIPGYRGPASAQGSWQNGVFYGPAGAEAPEALYADPNAIAERQERAAAARATADRLAEAERRQTIETQLRVIEAGRQANEYDDKHAQALRDWVYKTQVELPQALRKEEDVLKQAAITRGQQAGTSAVSDITAALPYRYSSGFGARQQAVQAEAARGNFTPGIYQSIARSYRGPDLAGARGAAESRYENQYLQQFDFDPLQTAREIPYRPRPAGAPPVTFGTDDEEALRRLGEQLAVAHPVPQW